MKKRNITHKDLMAKLKMVEFKSDLTSYYTYLALLFALVITCRYLFIETNDIIFLYFMLICVVLLIVVVIGIFHTILKIQRQKRKDKH